MWGVEEREGRGCGGLRRGRGEGVGGCERERVCVEGVRGSGRVHGERGVCALTWKVTVLSSLTATAMSSSMPHSSPSTLRKLWKWAR